MARRKTTAALLICAAVTGCQAGPASEARTPEEVEARVVRAFKTLSGPPLEAVLEASMTELTGMLPCPEATRLLRGIHRISPRGSPCDVLRGCVHFHQATVEIMGHIREAEAQMACGDRTKALEEFENAEFKIKAIPYDPPLLRDRLPEVRKRIFEIRRAWGQ